MYLYANRRTMRGSGPDTVAPGEFPRYLVHSRPQESADSGWAVFVGDETQADADDASNFQVNATTTLTDAHPALRQVIAVGVTGSWEWDATTERYVRLSD
jgi:hypothetical protein